MKNTRKSNYPWPNRWDEWYISLHEWLICYDFYGKCIGKSYTIHGSYVQLPLGRICNFQRFYPQKTGKIYPRLPQQRNTNERLSLRETWSGYLPWGYVCETLYLFVPPFSARFEESAVKIYFETTYLGFVLIYIRCLMFFCHMFFLFLPITLPKFSSSPLKSYRAPIGKDRLPTTNFRVYVKLWGCILGGSSQLVSGL